jgi:putative aldouronate transport system substrate-binding protein
MMRKILAKPIIVCLLLSLLLSIFTGCTKSSEKDLKADLGEPKVSEETSKYPAYLNMNSEFPIVKEGNNVTLTVACTQRDADGGDVEDIWFWKWASKTMNIKLDVTHILVSTLADRKQIMFASGDIPDVMYMFNLTPVELVKYGQIDKQLLAFNDYLNPELMPAASWWFEDMPELYPACTCPDGNMYTLPLILSTGVESIPNTGANYINKTWLKEINMDSPETFDEFVEMLKKFKEEDPGKVGKDKVIPLGGAPGGNLGIYILNSLGFINDHGYGLRAGLRNGEVVIPCGDETFKEYLKIFNSFIKEGFMAKDVFTKPAVQSRAEAAEGLNGFLQSVPYTVQPEVERYTQWIVATPLTSEFNPNRQWLSNFPITIGRFIVNVKTKYPEVIARLADFYYTDKGAIYKQVGPPANSEDTLGIVEGYTVDEKTGEILFPLERADEAGTKHNYNWGKIFPNVAPLGNHAYSMYDKSVNLSPCLAQQLYGAPVRKHEWDLSTGEGAYRSEVVRVLVPLMVPTIPTILYFNQEETERITDLQVVLKNYVEAEVAKFITGERPIEEFDQYLKELKGMGIEEFRDIYARAYENYKKQLK